MTMNFSTKMNQAQEFLLRLFVDPKEYDSTPSYSHYTCAHVGTHARLHQ